MREPTGDDAIYLSMEDMVEKAGGVTEREHPEDVRATIAKLEAMAAVRPELAPVVLVALEVVKSAREELRDAVVRAELAEETLAGVRPHVDELSERAEALERDVAARSAIDAAEDARRSRDAEAAAEAEAHRRAWTPTPRALRLAGAVAEQVADLAARQQAQAQEATRKAVEIITVIHKAVKNEDGRSPVQVWGESGHVWTVRDADGAVIAETDSRREAIQLVSDLLEEELAEEDAAKSADQDEAYRPTDTTHRPEPWRRKRPARVEQPPGPSAGMDGASKRKRKQSRIM